MGINITIKKLKKKKKTSPQTGNRGNFLKLAESTYKNKQTCSK